MRKRSIIAIFMAMCLILVISTGLQVFINDKSYDWVAPKQGEFDKTLKVVADMDYEPISFVDENGKPAGYDVELMYIIGEKLGYNVEIDMKKWTDAIESFKAGEYDVLLSVSYDADRLQWLDYTTPYINEPYIVFCNKSSSFSVQDLFGNSIGLLDGDSVSDYIIDTYSLEASIQYYPDYQTCFEKLDNGECEYVIAPKSVGLCILNDGKLRNVEVSDFSVYNSIYCYATQQSDKTLNHQINDVMYELNKDGRLEKLYDYWLAVYTYPNTWEGMLNRYASEFIFIGVAILSLFSVVMFYYENRNSKMLKLENAIVKGVQILTNGGTSHMSMQELLKCIGEYYNAENAVVFMNNEKDEVFQLLSMWKSNKNKANLDKFNRVSYENLKDSIALFRQHKPCIVGNPDKDIHTVMIRNKVKERGLRNFIMEPIYQNDKLIGSLGVSNVSGRKKDPELLKTTAGFISEIIIKQRLMDDIQELSVVDTLTGFWNNTKYEYTVEEYIKNPPKKFGLLYVSYKTHKEQGMYIPDENLLFRCASIIRKQGAETYRMARGEFAIFLPGIAEANFYTRRNNLQRELKDVLDDNFAVAGMWVQGTVDILAVIDIVKKDLREEGVGV